MMNSGIATIRELLSSAIMSIIKPARRDDQPRLCDELGLPPGNEDAPTKSKYVESRLAGFDDETTVLAVADAFVTRYPVSNGHEGSFEIEEHLWSARGGPTIPKKYRREIARALYGLPLYLDGDKFLETLSRLFVLESKLEIFESALTGSNRSLKRQIEQHTVRNDDWDYEQLFQHLRAFEVSDRRFTLLLEALASPDVRPDEQQQRRFVAITDGVLRTCGLAMPETGNEGGYPIFSVVTIASGVVGRPKNLIFASPSKPDLRFREAVNNDIEIVRDADEFLVYDRPFPPGGSSGKTYKTGGYSAQEGLRAMKQSERFTSVCARASPQTHPRNGCYLKPTIGHFDQGCQCSPRCCLKSGLCGIQRPLRNADLRH